MRRSEAGVSRSSGSGMGWRFTRATTESNEGGALQLGRQGGVPTAVGSTGKRAPALRESHAPRARV